VNHRSGPSHQRGLSIVEFMVGIAVGLFIVGGATKLFTDFIVSNKRLMLETRVNQDLRAAADIVARDVRRAGYWNNSIAGVWGTGSAAITPNPHATGAGAVASTASSVNYSYARSAAANLDATDPSEFAGFRVVVVNGINVLQMQDGQVGGVGSWQAVTDPGTVNVTTFSVTPASPALENNLSSYCACLTRLTCTLASIAATGTPPVLTIPSFTIVLTGQSVADPTLQRTVNETVRVRNSSLTGTCPA
jgi:prepilin peptidase dependent protein B